ncbi:hypothetical protein Y032_0304g1922 [Ancylostoma ceylanicum]|uniref:Uncharacterized protein n=1 Tax=Ancylostoma ceylanicum TaxID=53326 RepID=A0A016S3B5_9BILA|nr:hypothetical protein Y032_0304g1922 [Ancylostoma ceylanicum]
MKKVKRSPNWGEKYLEIAFGRLATTIPALRRGCAASLSRPWMGQRHERAVYNYCCAVIEGSCNTYSMWNITASVAVT